MSEDTWKLCFLGRPCDSRCMALRVSPDGEPVCALLDASEALTGALVRWVLTAQKQGEQRVVHGKSAPPPEVT